MENTEDMESAVRSIRRRISSEPRCEKALYRILKDCIEPISFDDLEQRICLYPEMRVRPQEPSTLVSWLVDVGALEAAEFGGDPAAIALTSTEAGRAVCAAHEDSDDVGRLIEEAGPLGRAYRRVLELCRVPRTKKALEEALVAEGLLDTRARQVSCFLDKLEKAGGLVWDGGWTTTQRGFAYLG